MTEEQKREIENMLNKYSRRKAYAEEELDEDMRCLYESKINDIFEILKIMGHEVKCAGMVKLPNKEYKYFLYSIIKIKEIRRQKDEKDDVGKTYS